MFVMIRKLTNSEDFFIIYVFERMKISSLIDICRFILYYDWIDKAWLQDEIDISPHLS